MIFAWAEIINQGHLREWRRSKNGRAWNVGPSSGETEMTAKINRALTHYTHLLYIQISGFDVMKFRGSHDQLNHVIISV